MSKLSALGGASNEAKEQRIMKLRNDFNSGKVVTVASVRKLTGYSITTILNWAKQGDIPLIKDNGESVVPLTDKNMPAFMKGK